VLRTLGRRQHQGIVQFDDVRHALLIDHFHALQEHRFLVDDSKRGRRRIAPEDLFGWRDRLDNLGHGPQT
jgi:hypothetical protein